MGEAEGGEPVGLWWPLRHRQRKHPVEEAAAAGSGRGRMPYLCPCPGPCLDLDPGPDFFLLAAYALRHRLRGSIGICIGIALGNGCYILLAMLGAAAIQQMPLLFILLQLVGALYLLWVG